MDRDLYDYRKYNKTDPIVRPKQEHSGRLKKDELGIDLAFIGAEAIATHLRSHEENAQVTSLYEIKRVIRRRKCEEEEARGPDHPEGLTQEPDIEELVRKVVPPMYWHMGRAFSKRKSDELPKSTPRDLKIKLDKELGEQRTPLYRMSSQELEAVYEYITDSLKKGFIEPSGSPFASPILIVPKPNGNGLKFCVDYRKLNAATRRNQYRHPLIEETLQRLSKAKVFSKIDIRQAFHRVSTR